MQKAKFVMQMPRHSYEHLKKEREPNANPLPAVESSGNASRLLDKYREIYLARHGNPALIADVEAASRVMRKLIELMGFDKSAELIKHYLSMPTEVWFLKQGYTTAALGKHLEEIYAHFSLTKRNAPSSTASGDLMIRFETRCPQCDVWFWITCRASEMGRHAHSTACEICQLV